MACGNGVVSFTRMLAPRSKSALTSSGTLASRCMRFKKAPSAYGSAFGVVRPLAAFTRIRPPTLVSRIRRTNFRYSREPELEDVLEKGMKTNCATSSRRVMVRIQRRTVEEVLSGAVFFAGTGGRRTAPAAPIATRQATIAKWNRPATLSVCQIFADTAPGRAPALPGG